MSDDAITRGARLARARFNADAIATRIQGGPGPVDDDPTEREPDDYAQWQIDQRADEAADAYEEERGY